MHINKMFRNTDRKTNTVGDTVGSIQKGLLFCVPGNGCYLLNKVTVKKSHYRFFVFYFG